MTYLLDTDHITILQRETGPDFAMLRAWLAQESPGELAFSIISLHEQVVGCHTYINRASDRGHGGTRLRHAGNGVADLFPGTGAAV